MWLERPAPCFEMQLIKSIFIDGSSDGPLRRKVPAFELRLEVTCRPDAGSLPRG